MPEGHVPYTYSELLALAARAISIASARDSGCHEGLRRIGPGAYMDAGNILRSDVAEMCEAYGLDYAQDADTVSALVLKVWRECLSAPLGLFQSPGSDLDNVVGRMLGMHLRHFAAGGHDEA